MGDGGVFWANRGSIDDGAIMFWAEDLSEPTVVASPLRQPMQVAVDEQDIWWLNASSAGAGPGSLHSIAVDGGPLSFWATFETPRTLAVDEERVFVGDAGSVMASFKDSGPFTVLVSDAVTRGSASDGVHFYWTDAQGRVGRIPVAGGAVDYLADLPGARGIAVDDACLFVAVRSPSGQQNGEDGSLWTLRK